MTLATANIYPLDKYKVIDYLASQGIVTYTQCIMALNSSKATDWEVMLVSFSFLYTVTILKGHELRP